MQSTLCLWRRFIAVLLCGLLPWVNSPVQAESAAVAVTARNSIASINLCADQLILLLADHEQILTLSNLSHQHAASYFYKRARQYPINEGHSEQILGLEPDVVIVGQYSNTHTVNLLREVGLRVETLPIATDIESMLKNVELVAGWLGHGSRGSRVVAALRARLAQLEKPSQTRPVAAVYNPNGYTSGKNTLRGRMLELAGWDNAASIAGIENYGHLSLEAMIHLAPDALIKSSYSPGTYSRAQAMSQHPALLGAGLKPLIIPVPSRKTICAGPWTVGVIENLQSERLTLQGNK